MKTRYELRAVIFEYDNIQMWATERSKLLQTYNTNAEAEGALKKATLGHYKGKYIFQHISTLRNWKKN